MRTIREVLERKARHDVISVTPSDAVLEAVKRMDEANIGSVVVLDAEQVIGIFTERDLMRRVVLQGRDVATTKVRDVMTSNLIYAEPGETTSSIMSMMTQHRCRHLPVVDNDKLVGVVSVGDLMKEISEEKEVELRFLKEFIQG